MISNVKNSGKCARGRNTRLSRARLGAAHSRIGNSRSEGLAVSYCKTKYLNEIFSIFYILISYVFLEIIFLHI